MQNQPAKPLYRYTPAKPTPIQHFDYSKLSSDDIFMLHTAAICSEHLTKAQRERLINLSVKRNHH